jgi:hypothetical protein
MRVFYATIVGLVVRVEYFISYRILYGLGNKTSYGYSAKIKYRSRETM